MHRCPCHVLLDLIRSLFRSVNVFNLGLGLGLGLGLDLVLIQRVLLTASLTQEATRGATSVIPIPSSQSQVSQFSVPVSCRSRSLYKIPVTVAVHASTIWHGTSYLVLIFIYCYYISMPTKCFFFFFRNKLFFSSGRGSFLALSAAGHAGDPPVHHGASVGPGRAPWRLPRASQFSVASFPLPCTSFLPYQVLVYTSSQSLYQFMSVPFDMVLVTWS